MGYFVEFISEPAYNKQNKGVSLPSYKEVLSLSNFVERAVREGAFHDMENVLRRCDNLRDSIRQAGGIFQNEIPITEDELDCLENSWLSVSRELNVLVTELTELRSNYFKIVEGVVHGTAEQLTLCKYS